MKNKHDIHQLLTTWGARERRLPLRNEELKQKALAGLSGMPATPMHIKTRLPWTSFAFAALAAVVFFLNSGSLKVSPPVATVAPTTMSYTATDMGPTPPSTGRMAVEQDGSAANLSAPEVRDQSMSVPMSAGGGVSAEYYNKSIAPGYFPAPPYYNQGVPITDTREFNKIDYNATIRTRDVEGLTRRVETTVRGSGGRVDSSTSAHEYGYVSFAVPADKFEAFRDEIESFVGSRFITTQISTENLLPQKQSLEDQKKQIEKDLATFKADRQKLVASHNSTVASLKSQLDSVSYELAALAAEQTTDPARRVYIYNRTQVLVGEQSSLQSRIASENSSYSRQLSYADSNIKQTEDNLQGTAKQDQTLLDNVATVRGTISLSWISIWDVVKLYISPNWMLTILIAGALVSYAIHRRRSQAVLV